MSIAELRSYGVELHQQSLRGRRTTEPGVIDNQRLNYPIIVGLMTEKAQKLHLKDIDVDALYREIVEAHTPMKQEPLEEGTPEEVQEALRQLREFQERNGHAPVETATENDEDVEEEKANFLEAYEEFLDGYFEGENIPKYARQYFNDWLVAEYGHTPNWGNRNTEGQPISPLSVDSKLTNQQRDKADSKAMILTFLRRYPDQEFCVEQVRERLRSQKSHKTIKRYLDELESEGLIAGRSSAIVVAQGKVVYPRFYQARC